MKKFLKISLVLLIVILASGTWFYYRVTYDPPVDGKPLPDSELTDKGNGFFTVGNSWLRKNKYGNWECYIEGNGYERGRVLGLLTRQLAQEQEAVFVSQIDKHVHSWWLQKALLIGIAWFNRDLDRDIPREYREEIYGISQYFSDDYDYIGPKYNRIVNYHAAHDIGHAVQNMHLVGCTAFGVWKFDSTSQSMLMGRNFDFYFGDDFARNKIVLLSNPDSGYKNISVTWAGFTGVVSGLNEKGLGVTLNSDKSEIPEKSGTPVSIIGREILQYAATIDEAIAIARKYTSFVSESFTVSSALDGSVAVVEKTPDSLGVYYPPTDTVVVTNHFQSPELKDLPVNIEHKKTSESVERYQRTAELLKQVSGFDKDTVAAILRDQKGPGGENIGMGNPMAINQLLAHHAVVFDNVNKTIWVSAYPWQINVLLAYRLADFDKWKAQTVRFPITDSNLIIREDTFYLSKNYADFLVFKGLKKTIKDMMGTEGFDDHLVQQFIDSNPEYYLTWQLLGDYFYSIGNYERATGYYETSLTKAIAYDADRQWILDQLKRMNEDD